MSISRATEEDIPTLVELVNAAYRGHPSTEDPTGAKAKAGWTQEAHLVGGQRIDSATPNELRSTETSTIYKYVEDGKILGCVRVIRVPEEKLTDMATLSVWPHIQAKGLGSKLITFSEELAREEHRSEQIRIFVIVLRQDLIAFYKRRGYQETGESVGFEGFGAGTALLDNMRLVALTKPL